MKNYILLFYVLFVPLNLYSQAPQGFNYQAIVRDYEGNIKSNTGVQFIFNIQTANGVSVYSEIHTVITNKYGLIDLVIGKGITSEDFSNINWSSTTYMLNVTLDGVDLGATQLMSVPYALYAVSSGSSSGGGGVGISSTVDNGDGTFTLNYTDGTSFTTTNLSGKSAYQLWIDKGNSGTEEDFLASLEPVTLENTKFLSLNGQEIVGKTVPIIAGGTGAVNVTAARTNLGVDPAGTDNSTDVTLGGTSNYLTISGQEIIRGKVNLSNSVTGDLPVSSLSGTLPIAQGGTGAVTAKAARVALGLDGIQTNVTTNLSTSTSSTTLTVASSDGTDAVLPVATTSAGGVMSAALFDQVAANTSKSGITSAQASAITANTAKETNVSTNLSTSTSSTTLTVASSDGDDAVLPVVTTSAGGVMSAALFDQVAANTAKGTNVSTNLSTSTSSTTLTVASSDGDDAVLPVATTSSGGVMSAALFDAVAANTSKSGITSAQASAITANTAKETNVTTDLSTTTSSTTLTVASSDGDDAVLPVATTSSGGVMSAALFDAVAANTSKSGITSAQASAITANTAKETNVTTDLSTTTSSTTLTVASSDGDDAVLPVATTSSGGVMSAALFDAVAANTSKSGITSAQASAITANTAKETNVSTDLSTTTSSTTLTVASSDGTNAVLPVATTSAGGVMSAAIFDAVTANTSKSGITSAQASAITANTAKETNVSTNLSTSTSSTTLTVASSDGNNAVLPVATTSAGGVMSAALFDEVAANTSKSGITSAQATTIANLGTISTQDANAVNIDGGAIDGVTIGTNGVVTQAVIDNININGSTIGHTGDTDLLTLASGIVTVAGEVSLTTLDIGGTNVTADAGELNILDGVTATTAELNIMDGGTSATSTTIVNADRIVLNDDGTMKQVAVTDLNTYLGGVSSINDLSDALVETNSMYIGNVPSSTNDAIANVAVGTTALDAITTGDGNTAVGYEALTANTSGGNNDASGYQSLYSNTEGSNNTASGYASLYSNTTGAQNTAVGGQALWKNQTGTSNTAVGQYALKQFRASGDTYNTAVGRSAMRGPNSDSEYITGINNTAVGAGSMKVITSGSNNTALGYWSQYGATITGDKNTSVGATSMQSLVNGASNSAVGYGALYAITGGDYNNALGKDALKSLTSGDYNIGVGNSSLRDVTTGDKNVAIGQSSLQNNTASGNTAIGYNSAIANTSGTYNTAVGYKALAANTTADYNTAVGYNSMLSTAGAGTFNTGLGARSLETNTTGDDNTGIGVYSMFTNATGNENTGVGRNSLYATTGSYNTSLGWYSANEITSGTYNTVIGHNTSASGATAVNQTVIGAGATGQANNSVTLGNADVTAVYASQDGQATVYTGGLVLEGATANAHETTLGVVDPTADATLNLPAMASGTYYVPVLAAASTTSITSTPAELNIMDGSATIQATVTLQGSDGIVISDGDVIKQALVSDIATYVGSNSHATTLAITDNENTNENNAVIFSSAGDLDGGNMGLESDGNLFYNPSTGRLTSTEASVTTLNLGGTNVTADAGELNIMDGATTQASITLAGTDGIVISDGDVMKQALVSDIATYVGSNSHATTVTITDNESTNEYNAIIFSSAGDLDGGNMGLESDGNLYYRPYTGTLTSTAFSGDITGNVTGNVSGSAATATTAAVGTTVTITDNESTNENNAIIFSSAGDLDGGNIGLESDGDLKYNPNTGTLTSTAFSGNITGNVTGNAATATLGTTVTITDNESTNEYNAIIFSSAGDLDGGNMGLESDGNLYYRPYTGTLTSTAFSGDITGNVTGNVSGSAATATTAAVGTTVTITDNESTNENNAIIFSSAGDLDGGNIGLESDGDLKYNPNTGTLTSTAFSGNITGNVTGNAATATLGTTVTITDNESTNEYNAIIFSSAGDLDGGNMGLESDGNLYYRPYTGTLTSTAFSGDITGNVTGNVSGSAATATTAAVGTTVTITDNESTNENNAIIFSSAGDLDGGNIGLESDGDLKYNPNTGTLTSTAFSGNITGNVTGNAATATLGTTVTITDNESTNEYNAIIFSSAGDLDGGNMGLESDGNLYYRPYTGTLTSTAFSGDITGNVTGNVSGSAATATTAAVGTTVTITDNESTNENNAIIFSSAGDLDGGNIGLESDGDLKYNPNTGTLTSTAFSGNITGNVTGNAATATLGTTVTITDNESTNEYNAIIFSSAGDLDGGNMGLESDGNLYYRPYTGTLTSTAFSGDITGNVTGNVSGSAATATTAAVGTTVTITDNESTNENNAIIFSSAGDLDGGNIGLESDGDLKYNPNTGTLTSTAFSGNITGNVTGNAATATLGTTVTITDNESTNEYNAIIFSSAGDLDGGNMGLESDGNLYYRPYTGTLTSTAFSGNITGNVTGNVSGSAVSISGVTSTNAELNIIDGNATTSSVTVVDADNIVINDGGTGGTMKQIAVTDLKTYVGSNPFIVAELDAQQTTTTTETAIGLNTTALVSLGSIFTINASDYIVTSEAGYYEVKVNVTWFKDENSSRYITLQIEKYSSGSWSDISGGRFILGAPSASPDYSFGSGSAIVQLSANDRIRVTADQDGSSSSSLYLRSSGINNAYPGDTTVMIKKIGE